MNVNLSPDACAIFKTGLHKTGFMTCGSGFLMQVVPLGSDHCQWHNGTGKISLLKMSRFATRASSRVQFLSTLLMVSINNCRARA
jgi:hypothetical protein